MSDVLRFICPDCSLSKDERIAVVIREMESWSSSDALAEMVSVFGQRVPSGVSLKERIEWLNTFADVWDYRKKQANGGERWMVKEDEYALQHKEVLMDCVRQLGLVDIDQPTDNPDFILPLGGARAANYARPEMAKKITDSCDIHNRKIVALSGKRPINEVEIPFLEKFVHGAKTEYDAISGGMETVLGLTSYKYCEDIYEDANINLSWSVRRYNERYNNNEIYSVAAPSSDPERRANSRDTFCFFLDRFHVRPGEKLLLVTSCIYVPFQLLKFIDLAIEKGFYVDCVGVANSDKSGSAFSQVSNYCQETKAVINSMYTLSQKWL